MDFIKIPYAGLLSEPYAAERRKLIDPQRASLELREGPPEKFQTDYSPVTRPDDTMSQAMAIMKEIPATSGSSTGSVMP